ncbi:MAG: PIN domain-containing protein [Solirubrobacteraceae bacterium]
MIAPDSSVTVAAAAPWHDAHAAAVRALSADEVSLIGHVAFETTAAMSRMPEGHRLAADVVLEWLEQRFPGEWLALPADAAHTALRTAVDHGIRGGALYDALVAATAAHHRHTLVTADRRAVRVYAALDVDVAYVPA